MNTPLLPLPMTVEELRQQGIASPDFIIVSGDAYVDHPSFGAAEHENK